MPESASTPNAPGIALRQCVSLAEFGRCVELQKLIWQYDDLDVTPSAILVVATKSGGHVLGAFAGGTMVGFVLGFAAFRDNAHYIHSHMAGVLPDCRDHGVGRQLKLFQREICLQTGIPMVEWTFDPLELKNAHFNIVRLGVVIRHILPDLYGVTTSPLHGALPTDRLTAEWAIASPRVEGILAGRGAPPVGRAGPRITLPANIGEMKRSDPRAAQLEQTRVRQEFQRWFSAGYCVTGFEREAHSASYLLEPYEG